MTEETAKGVLAFIGGTGPEGLGLALRLAMAGQQVVIGSRSRERAQGAAEKIRQRWPAAHVAGAENIEATERSVIVTTDVDHFESVRSALRALIERKRQKPEKKWGEAEDERPVFLRSQLTYTPLSVVRVDGEKAKQLLALIEDLEEHEDVQEVYADFDIPEESLT